MPARESNGTSKFIAYTGLFLTIIGSVVVVVLWMAQIRQVNAEQTKDITYLQQGRKDHEERLRKLEENRNILDKILDAVTDNQ